MTKEEEQFEPPLKVLVVLAGDLGTGKTSLVNRLINDTFDPTSKSTTGVNFDTHQVQVKDNTVIAYICDLAGGEEYRASIRTHYLDASVAMLVYDISNRATFENIADWLKKIRHSGDSKLKVMLIGNKSDLEGSRAVCTEEAQTFAADNELLFFETSALNGDNVESAFQQMAMVLSGNNTQQKPFQVVLVDIKKAAGAYIECVEKPLDEPGLKYVALSYRWGELEETVIDTKVGYTAMIKSFCITTFYLLCRNMVKEVDLRNIDYVWVDAICVDQTNYERRKATIYQMSAIYERAKYILAVPDLHARHLRQTSTLYNDAMVDSKCFNLDLYYLIHGNTDQLAQVEGKWLDKYGVPNDSVFRQSLKRDTDYFMDGLMTYREHHETYNAEEALDHITDHHHHEIATTSGIEEDHPCDWRRDGDDASLSMEHLHDCHQINCPLDLSHRKLPNWRESMIYKKERIGNQTWRQLVTVRSTKLRLCVDFMADLIKDWSSRVWVISEYKIAKKKNNMKYWFTQLGDFYFMEGFTFFPFNFTNTSLAATFDGIPNHFGPTSSKPAYITFHRTMISQLKQQTFFEMMLKSKASRNEDRFYAIFPQTEYKNTISSKAVVASWKIDTLVSVKLKLFEVVNIKDKLNLLFSSGNDFAAVLGEALPTFATASINWNFSTEHFTLDEKEINHALYNFDLTSPSTLTLHYHPSDHHPNLSDLPYLNLKPKEFYMRNYCEGPWKDRADWEFPAIRLLWRLLQPHEPTLMLVCIPSWTQTAMTGCNGIDWSPHVIYLVGDKKRNIWILEPTNGDIFVTPKFSFWTRCTPDDHCPGFNIY